MTKYILVGDIGSTNACFVLYDIVSGEISQVKTYSGLNYLSLEAVIRVYLEGYKAEMKDGCIAIARPITSDQVIMTNHTQAFSITEMKKNLGFNHLGIISDFTTVSITIPMLKKGHLIQFGGAELVESKPIAVYGTRTRLEVAHLVRVDERWVSLSGEDGHVDFVPSSEGGGIILEMLHTEVGHISTEHMLSGPGLVNLYRAAVKTDNRLPENLKPRGTIECTLADSCTDCRRTSSLFCVVVGRFDGNLTLDLGAFGGVSTADGIVPRFLGFFKAPGSHAAFEDRGHFKEYVHDAPACLTVYDSPGFLSSNAYLRQTSGHILQVPPAVLEGNSPDNLLNYTINQIFLVSPSRGRPTSYSRTAGLILQ